MSRLHDGVYAVNDHHDLPDGVLAPLKVGLLVDELLGSVITLLLRHLDGTAKRVDSETQLRALVKDWSPQIVFADIDRFEAAPEWISKNGRAVPCIAMTRQRETVAKLDAFARGAADVIEVPFTPDEIVGRTAAVYARTYRAKPPINFRSAFGSLEMDLQADGVRRNGKLAKLSPIELTLMYLFLANRGRVLSRDEILATLWGSANLVTSNVVDRHIRDLRVKLEDDWRQPAAIETVPGQGYRFLHVDGDRAITTDLRPA